MRDKKLSLEEHIENANDLAVAAHHLKQIYDRCENHFGKSHKIMKILWKLHHQSLHGIMVDLKCALDNSYHDSISDCEFKGNGNIYYNLEDRYKNIIASPKK